LRNLSTVPTQNEFSRRQFSPAKQDHAGAEAQVFVGPTAARLKKLLKKSEKQIPRGLKPARDDKNKGLNGAPKGAPLQNAA
jgi:hypothetical protein